MSQTLPNMLENTFMDELSVYSKPGRGTKVVMTKYIERENEQ